MAENSLGMSGHNFDAFVNSQRAFSDYDFAAKLQEKYWRARQKFLAKIEKKEDSHIVLSDSKLDAKLEIYRSIDRSCDQLTNILESYQNCLYMFANEENSLGVLLKEFGKHDKTTAGKIMSVVGKGLTQSSHQTIKLYMPLMRLYQEMETFSSRAVRDTSDTVDKLESKRSQYRASLLWMKDTSEKLDPDVYSKLDKFRRIQNQVKNDKRAFDSIQMDVVQKIDLLMASRCNLLNQVLASYQLTLLETFEKTCNSFRSIEEIIRNEDIHEYEFKTLQQLNSLKLSDSQPEDLLKTSSQRAESIQEPSSCLVADLLGDIDSDPLGDLNLDPLANLKLGQPREIKLDQKGEIEFDYLGDLKLDPVGDTVADILVNEEPDSSASAGAELPGGTKSLVDQEQDLMSETTPDKPIEKSSNLIDLLTGDLEDIENNSYFKNMQGLQL